VFRKWIGVVAALSAVVISGCGVSNSGSSAPTELIVSAAASLTDSLIEIQALYEQEHSDTKLVFNIGSSGSLQQQIEQGAPSDLFLSAGKKQMKALVDKQLIDESRQTELVSNELVIVVSTDKQGAISSITDLIKPQLEKLAIGEPDSVPAGSYAKESLEYYKLWDRLQQQFVYAKDVRQVLTYVETGNADAGFVYKTDAMTSAKVKVASIIDPSSYEPIEYPMGIVKATKHSQEAQDFYDFLQSAKARDIFVKYGFSVPKQK
jgi:molybdate transport system substrate-binding protein